MTQYDRTSVIVGVILVGIVLLVVLEIPSRAFQFTPLGTPLTFIITGSRVVALLLVCMCCAGTEAIMRTHPLVRRRVVRYTFPTWFLPALATAALALLLPQSPNVFYWLFGLTVGGAVLAWLILAHYNLLDPQTEPTPFVIVLRSLIAYTLALILFSAIYQTRLRSLVTATSITFVAFLVAWSILQPENKSQSYTVIYAAIIGLLMGETTWALNYWRANVLTVGVLLMLLFYILVGIVREHFRDQLNRAALIEFMIVAAAGVWIIIRFGN